MMYLHFGSFGQLLGILSLVIITPVNSEDANICNNTIGESGRCVNIKKCGTILRLLESHGDITRNFLRRFLCDFDDAGPRVCCPNLPELQYGPLFPPDCGMSIQKDSLIVNEDDTILSFPSRISAGENAVPGSWPWIAALGYRSEDLNKLEWRCGGSIISKRHVLTAAHCVLPELLVVRLGDIDLFQSDDDAMSSNIAIEKMYTHPNRVRRHKTHDIGILRLQRDIEFTDFIRPICLPVFDELLEDNYVGLRPFVIGWGRLGTSKKRAGHLQQVEIPVVDLELCKTVYAERRVVIDDRNICAGHPEGKKDACEGDSGGPLILPVNNTFYEIGITSYGVACGYPNLPGVYTSVSRNLDFILSKLD